MIPSWMIEKLREAELEQARKDRKSWDNQVSIEVDDSFRRPPPRIAPPVAPGERSEGGVVTIDFTI